MSSILAVAPALLSSVITFVLPAESDQSQPRVSTVAVQASDAGLYVGPDPDDAQCVAFDDGDEQGDHQQAGSEQEYADDDGLDDSQDGGVGEECYRSGRFDEGADEYAVDYGADGEDDDETEVTCVDTATPHADNDADAAPPFSPGSDLMAAGILAKIRWWAIYRLVDSFASSRSSPESAMSSPCRPDGGPTGTEYVSSEVYPGDLGSVDVSPKTAPALRPAMFVLARTLEDLGNAAVDLSEQLRGLPLRVSVAR